MRNFAKLGILHTLRAYQWALSPMLPPSCRYVPTCSEYAMEAVERFGAVRGLIVAFGRLLRCHPFAKGGYDPVVTSIHDHAVEGELWPTTPDPRPTTVFKKA